MSLLNSGRNVLPPTDGGWAGRMQPGCVSGLWLVPAHAVLAGWRPVLGMQGTLELMGSLTQDKEQLPALVRGFWGYWASQARYVLVRSCCDGKSSDWWVRKHKCE